VFFSDALLDPDIPADAFFGIQVWISGPEGGAVEVEESGRAEGFSDPGAETGFLQGLPRGADTPCDLIVVVRVILPADHGLGN